MRLVWLLLVSLAGSLASLSCVAPTPHSTSRTLQPGDGIHLSILGYNGPVPRYINSDGTIDVPIAKRLIAAQDLTEQSLARAMNDLLGEPDVFSVERVGALTAQQMKWRERSIRAGDLLAVTMRCAQATTDEPRLLRRVSADGTISLPWIGKFHIAGFDCVRAAREAEAVKLDTLSALHQTVLFEFVEAAEQASIPLGPIRYGDTLEIRMWDIDAPMVEKILHTRVSSDGDVELPLIGKFKLAGMTDQEAEVALRKTYRDHGLIQRLETYVNREKHDPRPPK